MSVVAYTSLNYGYLARGAVMARSLRRVHPDWSIRVLLVDEPDGQYEIAELLREFDEVVFAKDLPIDPFLGWIFRHDVVEACTAVKGAMLRRLLDEGAEKVVYLDPDIAVFHSLAPTLAALEAASIVLTPHQAEPNEGAAIRDNEMTSLRYGIFNLGFLAVRNDGPGRDFARWWDAQLRRECYDEPERGVFTDQKFCDLVPALFEGVHVDRDPGCNVASWNLSRRKLSFGPEGELLANGSPLKFYHFTKIFSVGGTMTDRAATGNLPVMELLAWYRRQVVVAEERAGDLPLWSYGRFDDGSPITKEARVLYRRREDLMATFLNPFATSGNSFQGWLGREHPNLLETAR